MSIYIITHFRLVDEFLQGPDVCRKEALDGRDYGSLFGLRYRCTSTQDSMLSIVWHWVGINEKDLLIWQGGPSPLAKSGNLSNQRAVSDPIGSLALLLSASIGSFRMRIAALAELLVCETDASIDGASV